MPTDLLSSLVLRLPVQKSIFPDLKNVVAISKFLSAYTASVGRIGGIETHHVKKIVGIESLCDAKFSAPVQNGPGAHPASDTMCNRSFSG